MWPRPRSLASRLASLGGNASVSVSVSHRRPADSTLDTTYDDSKMLVACLCFHYTFSHLQASSQFTYCICMAAKNSNHVSRMWPRLPQSRPRRLASSARTNASPRLASDKERLGLGLASGKFSNASVSPRSR